jgi:propionate CoA-transferase
MAWLPPNLTDPPIDSARYVLGGSGYAAVTRYTTSSFMRLKLSEQLSNRGLAPHIYESRQEAMNWNKK